MGGIGYRAKATVHYNGTKIEIKKDDELVYYYGYYFCCYRR